MKSARHGVVILVGLLVSTATAGAGVHYSGEIINELPTKWQGFIIDQRVLRTIARKPTKTAAATPMRQRYEKAVSELEKLAKMRKLTAGEAADLGALHLRLGDFTQAVSLLRSASKEHPNHFAIHANLGTAYQMLGELRFASAYLSEAVRLAPSEHAKAEKLHLRLVQLRLAERQETQKIDDLFGVRFVNDKGEYEPTKLALKERKKLPADAVELVQQLGLWLPHDGRLLWLLAELAGIHGNARISAAMMDGCVTEFLMRDRDLRRHRLQMKELAQELLKRGPDTNSTHLKHALPFKPKSSRPLANRFFKLVLPAIKKDGTNPLYWEVVTQTSVDRKYRPTFPKYLKELDGLEIQMNGYVQPLLGNDLEMTSFLLIEYPVGCWYCEVPELIAMIHVDLPEDKTFLFSRDQVRITGKLKLNSTDPEDFLYHVESAQVTLVAQ